MIYSILTAQRGLAAPSKPLPDPPVAKVPPPPPCRSRDQEDSSTSTNSFPKDGMSNIMRTSPSSSRKR